MVARAFSADGEGAFPNPQKQTADATTCFNELGYTTYEPCISAQYYLRQSLDAFIDDDNAYGLYLACHGDEDQTVLSGLGWTMGRDDIHGNWRFVFWMHVTPRQGLDGQINSTFIAIRKVARF